VALTLGRFNAVMAMLLWGAAAVAGAGAGYLVATYRHRDTFEGMIFGSLCAIMASAWPIGHFVLK
jgi:hypothetical protein